MGNIGWFVVEQDVERLKAVAEEFGVAGLTHLLVGVLGHDDYIPYYLCRSAGVCQDENEPIGLTRAGIDEIIMTVGSTNSEVKLTVDFREGAAFIRVDFSSDGNYVLLRHYDTVVNTIMTVVNRRSRFVPVVMAARAPFVSP